MIFFLLFFLLLRLLLLLLFLLLLPLLLLLGNVLSPGFRVYGKFKRALGDIENYGMQTISALAFCTVYHRTVGQKATLPLTSGSEHVIHQYQNFK